MEARFSAEDILCAASGRIVKGPIDLQKGRIVWQLDELQPGDWFLALQDGVHDGHDDLRQAIASGARGCIVNRRCRYAFADTNGVIISVSDTRSALFDLVRSWRYAVKPRVVGVSGTTGRRATMLLMNSLLAEKLKVHLAFMSSLGSLGCLSEVLAMPEDTELLIFEAAAVERGDVAKVGGTLDPDLAVITRIEHPLPSGERERLLANMYCELLETVETYSGNGKAVVYDRSAAVQERTDLLLSGMASVRFSQSASDSYNCVSEEQFEDLNSTLFKLTGQKLTRAELWCAIEAARSLDVTFDPASAFDGSKLLAYGV